MDWQHEIMDSAQWLATAYLLTLAVFSLLMAALARWTHWGQQFWLLTGAYFSPKHSWRPLLMVALMLLLALLSVRMNVLLSFWSNGFYSGLQALDAQLFWFHLRLFALLATLHVIRSIFEAYIQGAVAIHWRQWLNNRLIAQWIEGKAYYLDRFIHPSIDNPDQRIQQDVDNLVSQSIELAMGLVNAVVSMIEFTLILWSLSATMHLFGLDIPRAMVLLVYIYVISATLLAFVIGRPLIKLNFLQEKLNASYRYLLIRLREYGESIALYRGEAVEQRTVQSGFRAIIANAWSLLFRGLKFDGYNLSISQIAVIFPFLIQGPRLFAGAIKLGDVMQTSQAFSEVESALSFFRKSYDKFASYRAGLDRLQGFSSNLSATAQLSLPQIQNRPEALVVQGLDVLRPEGTLLTQNLAFTLHAGQSLLIRGPSGVGKTTLLRTLAGLWPFSMGQTARPTAEASLFLAQRPYLPLGSLRAALAYPAATVEDSVATAVLNQVQLGQLAEQLEQEADWAQILSPGEQQRLAFGRALINKPKLIFLDEATSAMDSGLEYALYNTLRQSLPQTMFVSVGHRETLVALHDQALTLNPDTSWELTTA